MKKQPKNKQFTTRLPIQMIKKLDKAARQNGASRNAEITRRLNNSLQENAA